MPKSACHSPYRLCIARSLRALLSRLCHQHQHLARRKKGRLRTLIGSWQHERVKPRRCPFETARNLDLSGSIRVSFAEGCHSQLVSADVKAAPATCSALARVIKQERAPWILAPANAAEIRRPEKLSKRQGNRNDVIRRRSEIPVPLQLKPSLTTLQPEGKSIPL
jgi:hypothetical protein